VRRLFIALLIALAALMALVAAGDLGLGPVVVTREGEQKLILLLGDVRTVTEPGATWRIPLLEDVEPYDSRWLHFSTEALPIQTKEGEQLNVDNYVVWRIAHPVRFRQAFAGKMSNAFDRIDGIVRDDVRAVIGRHTLSEVLKDRRGEIMRAITEKTRANLADDGIEVADVRINRTELPEGTENSVYARMRTERERLARKNRAEGDEQARRIRAESDREARVIVAEAKRDAEIARGEGDARATRIYAEAYSRDPEFYDFLRSLEAYRKTIDENTTLVLSPKAEFFRFLESTAPAARRNGATPP
jgi:membrane protease subunit HflC